MEIEKIKQLVVDEDALALVVFTERHLSLKCRDSLKEYLTHALKTEVPVLVLDGGMRLEVLKAKEVE